MGKILPIFLAMLIIFNTVIPPKQTDAIAPAIPWIARALVGDVIVDLGWKYVGKPVVDKITDKVSGTVVKNAKDFDFLKKKPKKNGKKIDIDISPLDRLKIATLIKKEGAEIIELDKQRVDKITRPTYEVDFPDVDPFYNTGIFLDLKPTPDGQEFLDFFTKFINIEFMPNAYDRSTTVTMFSALSGDILFTKELAGGTPTRKYDVDLIRWSCYEGCQYYYELRLDGSYETVSPSKKLPTEYWLFQEYKRQLSINNRTIYLANGFSVPQDNTRIIEIPIKTPSTYVPPNADKLDIDISIPIITDDDTVIDLDWEDLDIYLPDIENYYNITVNKSDLTVNNNYNTVINKYYYICEDGSCKTQEEIDEELPDIPDLPDDGTPPEDKEEGSIWKNIIPIAMLLVLLDLLISVILYLGRMLEFVLTIPMIEAIPIENDAFEWFKRAKILGVQIYEVISLMATVGLSFGIYKAVKKVLP